MSPSPDKTPPLPLRIGYAAGQNLSHRQIQVLRALGRLGTLDSRVIYALCYQGEWARDACYDDLRALDAVGYVWRGTAPTRLSAYDPMPGSASGKRGGRPSSIYSLSDQGKDALLALGVESDEESWNWLRARSRRGRPPERPSLAVEALAGWWCASVVAGFSGIPWCHGALCWRPTDEPGHPLAGLFDALLLARFNPARPRPASYDIPWMRRSPPRVYERDVLLGLIVDRHWLTDAQVARRLRPLEKIQEELRQTFGRFALPVVVADDGGRLQPYRAMVGKGDQAYQWGLGLNLDRQGSDELRHGALWASYTDLLSGKAAPLLARVDVTLQRRFRAYEPLLERAHWERLLELQASKTAPTRLAELLATTAASED